MVSPISVLGVALGVSLAAVVIIILTLVCLCSWRYVIFQQHFSSCISLIAKLWIPGMSWFLILLQSAMEAGATEAGQSVGTHQRQ